MLRIAFLLAVVLASIGAQASSADVTATRALVASVYDGDTLTLTTGKRVRLVQIDAPELGTGECYSRASATKLRELVPVGSAVTLERDPRLDDVDRYGRLLRYIRRGATNVNVALVRAGGAAPYFYGGDRGRYASALLSAATRARAAKRGLWGACPRTTLDPDGPVETGVSGPPAGSSGPRARCDASYTGACIPSPPPDLDCAHIRAMGAAPVRVVGSDPHRLDGDDDGWGCE
jgi:micrococcal nuclease